LLNFGAYSIPDTGGWLVLAAGAAILLAVVMEFRRKKLSKTTAVASVLVMFFLSSCSQSPQAIKINKDNCSFCEMTIADLKFGVELMTDKGKVYKFDDLSCMNSFVKEQKEMKGKHLFAADYLHPEVLMPLEGMSVIRGGSVSSPMGGNMATFKSLDTAKIYAAKLGAELIPVSETMK
jgi:copper chaperone NosL